MESTVADQDNDLEGFRCSIDEILTRVHRIEKQLVEVEQFYETTGNVQVNNSKGCSVAKEKGREKHLIGTKRALQDSLRTETVVAKRMQELMRQFSTILRQITQHKWAWPFLDPVDIEGLGLHDYYEVIDKPMDFSTIKSKIEAKDGIGYKNVREIYADVRLIFKNAMKYNNENHDVHVMAKTLLEKFEEKWLQLLPKVAEEEKRQLEEETDAQQDMRFSHETTYANMARDLGIELSEIDMHLKSLKEMVIQKFRKLSTKEKKMLGIALMKLSSENVDRALKIVAENNPSFQSTAAQVDLDFEAQSNYTLWKLKVFVKDALEVERNISGGVAFNHNDNSDDKKNNSKRSREFCVSFAETNVKRTRKLSTM